MGQEPSPEGPCWVVGLCRGVCAGGSEPSGSWGTRASPPQEAPGPVTRPCWGSVAEGIPSCQASRTHRQESSRGWDGMNESKTSGSGPHRRRRSAGGLTGGREHVGSPQATQLGAGPRLAPDKPLLGQVTPLPQFPHLQQGQRHLPHQHLCLGHLTAHSRSTGTDAAAGRPGPGPPRPPHPQFRGFLSQEAVRAVCSATFSCLEGSAGCLSSLGEALRRHIEEIRLEINTGRMPVSLSFPFT